MSDGGVPQAIASIILDRMVGPIDGARHAAAFAEKIAFLLIIGTTSSTVSQRRCAGIQCLALAALVVRTAQAPRCGSPSRATRLFHVGVARRGTRRTRQRSRVSAAAERLEELDETRPRGDRLARRLDASTRTRHDQRRGETLVAHVARRRTRRKGRPSWLFRCRKVDASYVPSRGLDDVASGSVTFGNVDISTIV